MQSLYFHIPFCDWVCHYCDFAKTANFSAEIKETYLKWLEAELNVWLKKFEPEFSTVFFGGGTPSIFAEEYAPLFKTLRPLLNERAEVSLEANPDHVTSENLAVWRDLGFNRLSLGVQSFQDEGLKFLTRRHTAKTAKENTTRALSVFPNTNIDLIYGWPGQSREQWRQDLNTAVELGVPHLSLYCLTFESRTVIGRQAARGQIAPQQDDDLWHFYNDACELLKDHGYLHEEVSNWCKPGHSCDHNWVYWTDKHFLGIGTGAHGYVPSDENFGQRYVYPASSYAFARGSQPKFETRTPQDWLLEYLGSSLRTVSGTSLALIKQKQGLKLEPNAAIAQGLKSGVIQKKGDSIILSPEEWFREVAWAGAIEASLVAD